MITYEIAMALMFPTCAVGLIWAGFNLWQVVQIKLNKGVSDGDYKELKEQEGTDQDHKLQIMLELGDKISNGAEEFLRQEYIFCLAWLAIMCIVLYCLVDQFTQGYVTLSFLIGGLTSISSGYVSMKIATHSNYRTTYSAITGLPEAFKCAFRAGCAMGFSLVSVALAILCLIIVIYYNIHCSGSCTASEIGSLFEGVAGYGLGGSTVALFGRVGGGIYTKAADVGADLVGKVEQDLPEDSPKNPATIADNVGDNVGDVAGMGADLFGSFAESTCAALVVSGHDFIVNGLPNTSLDYLMYPLLTTAIGILVCLVVSAIGSFFFEVRQNNQIESTLKYQLLLSSVFLTPAIIGISYWCFPSDYALASLGADTTRHPWHAFMCTLVGLWAGLAIGYITEYMTSHSYTPVRDVANSCSTGAATNIIYGLALGYNSTIVPIISIMIASYVSHKFLGFYGVALSALGMLANLPIGLAIDGYGPISDNAGGIAEMAELGDNIRERTDALDAAGNTTAAIGKGFAIGSAALVSLALYGGFITNAVNWSLDPSNNIDHGLTQQSALVTDPLVFAGLLIGAMLPYAFSAFTMKSVGKAALLMVKEIRRQLNENPGIKKGEVEPDFKRCIKISTQASLKEMIAPGALVIFTPFVVGLLFGPKAVAGLLPGALISGVQMAISAANTGGAWDNAKKYIESGQLYIDGVQKKKGSDEHKAAVIGDTVGDPLKDTSGPSLNILVKLMAILSLVFATFFCRTGFLVGPFGDQA